MRLWPLVISICGVMGTFSFLEAAPDDPFAVGTVWAGQRKSSRGVEQDWRFKVEARDGTAFQGTLFIHEGEKKAREYKITGTIRGDKIEFKSEKKGRFEQTFTGVLSDGEIEFIWRGTNMRGDRASGTAKAKSAVM